eukprot:jgi/Bigna1/134596/aug1.26_g9304
MSEEFSTIKKIGEGTFSEVYKAERKDSPGEVVALKRIRPNSSPARIQNEVTVLFKLGGQRNVAKILQCMREYDRVTLALQYFPHKKFKDYYLTMSEDFYKQYFYALFEALDHLHTHGVIHRDIKPGNFLSDGKNQFLLVDYGLAQNDTSLSGDDISTIKLIDMKPSDKTPDDSTECSRAGRKSHRNATKSTEEARDPMQKRKLRRNNPTLLPSSSSHASSSHDIPRAGKHSKRRRRMDIRNNNNPKSKPTIILRHSPRLKNKQSLLAPQQKHRVSTRSSLRSKKDLEKEILQESRMLEHSSDMNTLLSGSKSKRHISSSLGKDEDQKGKFLKISVVTISSQIRNKGLQSTRSAVSRPAANLSYRRLVCWNYSGRTLEIKNIEAQDQRPYLTDLGAKLKGWQRKAFKFMMKCLALSPKSRIRADQALKNSFLARKIPRD